MINFTENCLFSLYLSFVQEASCSQMAANECVVICLSVCQSVNLSVSPFVSTSVRSSIRPSVRQSNKYDTVIHKDVIPNVIADHGLINVIVNISKPKHKTVMKTCRHLGVYSNDALCNALLTETPTPNKIPLSDDVHTQVNILTSVLTYCLDQCAPLVT